MDKYPRATWRLILSPPADGAANMALDEAILRAVAHGRVPPTLRLYAWQPPCLSMGRAQPVADVDTEALCAAGFDLVRRPTGGRAILHIDELTYCVVAPETEPRVVGGIVESYRHLSAGLVRGLSRLGIVNLIANRRVEAYVPEGPVCFEVPSDYEITVGGRKLVGSAQMRALDTMLQHGVVPLHGDVARICQFLTNSPDPARVRARAVTVHRVLGQTVAWGDAAEAMRTGLAEALNLELEPGALTADERAWAEQLRAEKYATDEWTHHV